MSIFKHKNSSKCLSFGELGHSFYNETIDLKECPPNLSEPKIMDDSKNGEYKLINEKDSCVHYDDNLNFYSSAECDANSIFTIHNSLQNANYL